MQMRRVANTTFYEFYANVFASPRPVSDGSYWRAIRVIWVAMNATVVRGVMC